MPRKKLMPSVLIFILVLSVFPVNAVSLSYDRNGNLIEDDNFSYEYNSLNQLEEIKNNEGKVIVKYFYDHEGSRIKKEANGLTTYYLDGYVLEKDKNGNRRESVYYYHNGELVGVEEDGEFFYYHPDLLGSTSLVTDINGKVVERTEYKPFGLVEDGGDSRYLFTGQEYDKESELYYYGARYYSPEFRRFIQP